MAARILLAIALSSILALPASANPKYWCGGNDHVECPAGYLCDLRSFNCAGVGIEQSGIIGVCVKKPEVGASCPLGTHEVCGCHGNSYENDCKRLLAGEIKSSDGACAN